MRRLVGRLEPLQLLLRLLQLRVQADGQGYGQEEDTGEDGAADDHVGLPEGHARVLDAAIGLSVALEALAVGVVLVGDATVAVLA